MTALVIERVEVGTGHVDALVRVTDPALARCDAVPGLPERALALLPGLARHSCENDARTRFVDELRSTETAHLLEHVACELMALSGSPRSLRAETSWDFARDGVGVYRVRLAYDDDLVALGALREGVAIVEWLLGVGEEAADVDGITTRLRTLRNRA